MGRYRSVQSIMIAEAKGGKEDAEKKQESKTTGNA